MGYGIEQLQDVAAHLSTFATDEAIAGYHSAAGLEAGPAAVVVINSQATAERWAVTRSTFTRK